MQYKVRVWNGAIAPIHELDLEELLNKYSAEGWDLISVIPQTGSTYSSGDNISCVDSVSTDYNVLIFRKK